MVAWVQDVEEPEARAAFIWILGEHGQTIQVGVMSKSILIGDCANHPVKRSLHALRGKMYACLFPFAAYHHHRLLRL